MAIDRNDSDATPDPALGGAAPKKPGIARRLLADPLRVVFFLAVNLALVVGFTATVAIWKFRPQPPKPVTVKQALQALERGDYISARYLAERVIRQGDVSTEDWGSPDYVLGAFVARSAEKATGKRRVDLFNLASRFLAESRERGFPKGRELNGLYLLGKSLFECGRPTAAQPILEEALRSRASPHIPEIRDILFDSLICQNAPDLKRALEIADRSVADASLTEEDRYHAMIRRGKALLRMGRLKDCAATLAKITGDTAQRPDTLELHGELLYREAVQLRSMKETADSPVATTKFREAIELFRRVPAQGDTHPEAERRALYLTGVCLVELNDLRAAYAHFDRICHLMSGTPEGLAAAFQTGEVARRLDRRLDALLAYRVVAQSVPNPDDLQNQWVTTNQLRNALISACQSYVAAGKFSEAATLAKSLPPLFSRADAMERLARVYREWGQSLLDQSESMPPDQAAKIRRQAHQHMCDAGVCYSAVASGDFTSRQFPEQLYLSADSFLAGNDFRSAVRVFKQYLHYEQKARHAQALVSLGDAQLSSGDAAGALASFTQCIDLHPRDVAVFRARLLGSRAASVVGNAKLAASLLQDNLEGEQLTPASKEWRESLFALGELLHSQGHYDEAIRRLDEALTRYPTAPQTTVARYLLADASRRRAMSLRADLDKEISATLRAEHSAEADRLLRQASEGYRQLRETLSRRDDRDMTAHERAILRNSRFAVGETLMALEEYPESLRAFQSAANACLENPEVLTAFVEISDVYARMGRTTEARAALNQARYALRRIPPQVVFTKTTNFDRTQWGAMLDWMTTLQR